MEELKRVEITEESLKSIGFIRKPYGENQRAFIKEGLHVIYFNDSGWAGFLVPIKFIDEVIELLIKKCEFNGQLKLKSKINQL